MISGCQGFRLGVGRVKRKSTGDFKGSATILYNTVMLDTWHYAPVKNHRAFIAQRVNFNVCKLFFKHRLGVWEIPDKNVDCDKRIQLD